LQLLEQKEIGSIHLERKKIQKVMEIRRKNYKNQFVKEKINNQREEEKNRNIEMIKAQKERDKILKLTTKIALDQKNKDYL